MAERPIIFSAPMVRAILDGRKTMMRRPVKPQPDITYRHSPFQVGTRLWVRETWRPTERASRITLEVTGVRVERVQEISEADCMAEGVREYEYEPTGDHPRMIGYVTDADGPDEYGTAAHRTPQEAFAKLWDSVNGPGAWDRNDWVWVVEFRPL